MEGQNEELLKRFQHRVPTGFRPLSVTYLKWIQDCAELCYQHSDGRIRAVLVHLVENKILGEADIHRDQHRS